jgi:hypothetical protein
MTTEMMDDETMNGLSPSKIEALVKLGPRMLEGRRIWLRSESGKRSRYIIQVEEPWIDVHGDRQPGHIELVPELAPGSRADSRTSYTDARYRMGGEMYVAAVEAAKDLASALGF